MASLPSVFVSHGSPMHALEPGAAGDAWRALGRRLARPKAIVIASAHWETNVPMLTGSAKPETIHDFHNFPEPLYRLRYPAPGAPGVAQRAQGLLKDAGFTAAIDGCRGLDHGAWAPLLYMYPDADVPVVQLSIQPELGPGHHLAVGRSLRKLLDEGVLIVGSGHMTHNLRDWMRGSGQPQPYAQQFAEWVRERLEAHDADALADYRARSPHGARAHPSDEHFLPLFIALGAARAHPTDEHFLPLFFALGAARDGYKAERFFSSIDSGVLSMDAYVFH